MTATQGDPAAKPPEPDTRGGVAAALTTYTLWGLLPLFFKLLEGQDPAFILANRIVFSLLLVTAILWLTSGLGAARAAFRNRTVVLAMLASSLLIASNWTIFIFGTTTARVLEVSFGYFINPLVSVAIGVVLLGERFSRLQTGAIGLALVAVAVQAWSLGTVPWVSLALALSFGFYGYVRKVAAVSAVAGLSVETLILTPIALGYIAWLWGVGAPSYQTPINAFWLVMTGPATAIPLILFAYAARQLRLSTMGMFQYIAPSLQFVLAVFAFNEPMSGLRLASFVLTWLALTLFTFETFRSRTKRTESVQPPSAQRTR